MTKRCIHLCTVALCCLPVAALSAAEGFTPLFNGKDLTGWVVMGTPDAFTVKDGAIFSTGASPYPSWLRSEKPYENFVLRFEYQTQGWYEGGFLIHAPIHGPGSKLGLKLHLRHEQKEYGTRSPGAIYDAATPRSIANLPSGQWNQCEIECDGPRLHITLNGTLIHDIDMDANDVLKYRLHKGFVGIQNIGCRAYFSNIEIRPLPGKEHWTNLLESGMDGFAVRGDADWQIRDEQWFLLQIFSDGPNAVVLVNGEKVCTTDTLKPPYRGGIGYQQHTAGATIQYRGARIKAWPKGILK